VISSDVGIRKLDPAIYLLVANKLGGTLKPACSLMTYSPTLAGP
jgi:FMN phosphatase YigB (HAD superfamily)